MKSYEKLVWVVLGECFFVDIDYMPYVIRIELSDVKGLSHFGLHSMVS